MKATQEHFITKEGLNDLKKELENLTTVVRPEVVADIKEARAQGDLSENAEYHAAREKQSIVEARIKELKNIFYSAVWRLDAPSSYMNRRVCLICIPTFCTRSSAG